MALEKLVMTCELCQQSLTLETTNIMAIMISREDFDKSHAECRRLMRLKAAPPPPSAAEEKEARGG
jgi:hypothetical protein